MNEEDRQNLVELALSSTVFSQVPLDEEQFAALQNLNEYCVHIALQNPEVAKNPLKIAYKTNEEFKMALVAFCLAYSLINPRRRSVEDKDFFDKNIAIYQRPDNVKEISFGNIDQQSVVEAINWEIVEDWKLYRDGERGGIKALVDEKTNLTGLENYKRGGNPLYEFARFHRKLMEKENREAIKSKIEAQNAFRNAVISSVASEAAKQQLAQGRSPIDIINSLLKEEDNLQIGADKSSMQIEDKRKK
ncbi:MAG: hypothetical protein J6T72_01840 [Alphaproteobacteria bacterium]|nr:hypothetical protein [Alphaproteobacteria bacterium]